MRIAALAVVLRLAWLAAEGAHARWQMGGARRDWSRMLAQWLPSRRLRSAGPDWDRSSGKLWDACSLLALFGLAFDFAGVGRIGWHRQLIAAGGLVLMCAGFVIRWTAIRTLGKYFTRVVTIRDDQRIVREGLYARLRHPSYAGALLSHLGFGLAFANWLSLLFIFPPMLLAALYRMRVEEEALRRTFGGEYDNYARVTKRLIPKVY